MIIKLCINQRYGKTTIPFSFENPSPYLSVENEKLEKRVHEEDPVRLDRARVEQHRLGRAVEGVRVQDGLESEGEIIY